MQAFPIDAHIGMIKPREVPDILWPGRNYRVEFTLPNQPLNSLHVGILGMGGIHLGKLLALTLERKITGIESNTTELRCLRCRLLSVLRDVVRWSGRYRSHSVECQHKRHPEPITNYNRQPGRWLLDSCVQHVQ